MKGSDPIIPALLVVLAASTASAQAPEWSDADRDRIASMSLSRLPPPPASPSNRVADDPRAAGLGQRLFFDPGLSRNGKFSCASCHQPELQFTDGLPRSRALGQVHRNAPSLRTAAWHRWQFWDGRADSLWMQATVPILNPQELGQNPAGLRELVRSRYAADFEALFGPLAGQNDGRLLSNIGKALEAFERTLRPEPARFDTFADALAAGTDSSELTVDEQAGLALFLGKGQCLRCHHGPLLTNEGFQNTGLAKLGSLPADRGRTSAIDGLLASEFNCRGPYNDDPQRRCPHLDYLRVGSEVRGAFKVPSLRDVARTAPYMHDGRFATLAEVLDHYKRAPGVAERSGHTELFPLALSAAELGQLEAFLRTLSPEP